MIKLHSGLYDIGKTVFRSVLPCKAIKVTSANLNLTTKNWSFQTISDDVKINTTATNNLKNPQIISILESVKKFGFEEFEMKSLLDCQPKLLKTNSTSWDYVVGTLLDYGFDKNDIFTILEKQPSFLFFKRNDLIKKLITWMNFDFGNALVISVLTAHPHLINVNSDFALKRVKQYQAQFESKRRVGKLLLLAPNTLEENLKVVCDKINYLNNLCTENSDIVSSGALAHTLFHIKARHEFLIRAGVYKRPQKDFNKKLNRNPKLEKIVNTTDEEFVTQVAGLSLFEYYVFLEMYEEELENTIEPGEIDSDDEELIHKLSYKKH